MHGWHHGRMVQGVRLPAGGEGAPIGLPESVKVVRPDVVRCVVAHGVRLLRSCPRSPRFEAVEACWFVYLAPYVYI